MVSRRGSGEQPASQSFKDLIPPPPPPPSPLLSESGTCSLDGEIRITMEIWVCVVEDTEEEVVLPNVLGCQAMIFQYVVLFESSFASNG
jgi:hypothetical protein